MNLDGHDSEDGGKTTIFGKEVNAAVSDYSPFFVCVVLSCAKRNEAVLTKINKVCIEVVVAILLMFCINESL